MLSMNQPPPQTPEGSASAGPGLVTAAQRRAAIAGRVENSLQNISSVLLSMLTIAWLATKRNTYLGSGHSACLLQG
jgi:hypothetical protein